MMIKVIDNGAQDFSEPAAALIKISSHGLLGKDRADFEKRAGAQFAHELSKIARDLSNDEPLVHLLAVGATEDYGSNRNGDGFTRGTCRDYHDTFTKFAHFFRDHKNKDPKKCYGHVKLSAYHEPMRRIELIVALNGSEKAASRNGGLFADKEMNKLASGKEIPVSMACRVPFDVCSYCGNKAKTRDEYCIGTDSGGHCKAGGLKDNIGSLVEIDGGVHQLHADNPNPTFFDISHVFRPADRIAYVSGQLEKAAGVHHVGGAELAEVLGVTMPYDLLIDKNQPSDVQRMIKLAYQLSDMEAHIWADSSRWVGALAKSVTESDTPNPDLVREKFASAMRAMCEQRICLPLPKFLEIVTQQPQEKAAATAEIVQRSLPGVYSRMLQRGDLADRIRENPYVPAPASSPTFRLWAEKTAAAYSMSEAHATRRLTRAALRQESPVRGSEMEKTAADSGAAGRLAEEYALYKLAFLGSIPESDNELQLTASLVLLQNYAM